MSMSRIRIVVLFLPGGMMGSKSVVSPPLWFIGRSQGFHLEGARIITTWVVVITHWVLVSRGGVTHGDWSSQMC